MPPKKKNISLFRDQNYAITIRKEISYIIAAPPPDPSQPVKLQPKCIDAIRKPISGLSAILAECTWA